MVGKSLPQLKRELASLRKRDERLRVKAQIKAERRKLQFDIARIRNPGIFRASKAISSGARKVGRGLLTQGKLIRQQQLREEAESRKLKMALKKSTVIKKQKIRKRKRLRVP